MALNINGTTGISGVDASVSAPALTGTDSNTGISFPAADTIKFSTGGVERMAITNSGITGISPGVTEADLFRLSSSLTLGTSWAVISANLERQDGTFSTHIGTGMSQSSGVFTFPSAGKYLIIVNGYLYSSANEMHYGQVRTEISSDSGSNYTIVGYGIGNATSGGAYGNFQAIEFVDVTDESDFRCRFQVRSGVGGNGDSLIGYTGENATTFTFIRLGGT